MSKHTESGHKTSKDTPPWKKLKPKQGKSSKLTEHEKEEAKARAEAAGRPYPNLVDNMAVIRNRKR